MSPGLPLVEILPPLAVLVIELSSIATPMMMDASPTYLECHQGITPTYEEDRFEELSTAMSCTPQVFESSCAAHVEVLNR